MAFKARLGRIQYLNVLPIYFALEHLFGENGFHLVAGTPAELNAAMRRGEVDLGSISALEYGRHPDDYLLLPDLSISSRGPVGSVLLFSRVPFAELDGRSIRVSNASASGAALLKVLMAKLFRVKPRYEAGTLAKRPLTEAEAIMAIGDEALCLKQAKALPFELDLGEAWQELTGLPFVFGVWAVRRAFAISPARGYRSFAPAAVAFQSLGAGIVAGVEPDGRQTLRHDPGAGAGLFPPTGLCFGTGARTGLADVFSLFARTGRAGGGAETGIF